MALTPTELEYHAKRGRQEKEETLVRQQARQQARQRSQLEMPHHTMLEQKIKKRRHRVSWDENSPSPVEKKIRVPTWCQAQEIRSYTSQDLNKKEQGNFQKLARLAQKWGYRAGESQAHVRFEKKLHDSDLYFLTQISDVLFRGIEQQRAYPSDYVDKLQYAQLKPSPEQTEKLVAFVSNFLSSLTGTEQKNLAAFARQPVDNTRSRNNPWYVAMVISARILFLISKGKMAQAQELLTVYQQCLNQ